jgi:hypothetical protein
MSIAPADNASHATNRADHVEPSHSAAGAAVQKLKQ